MQLDRARAIYNSRGRTTVDKARVRGAFVSRGKGPDHITPVLRSRPRVASRNENAAE